VVQIGCWNRRWICPLCVFPTDRSSSAGAPRKSPTAASRFSTTPFSIAPSADGCRWLVDCRPIASRFSGRPHHVVPPTSSGWSGSMVVTSRVSRAPPWPSSPAVSVGYIVKKKWRFWSRKSGLHSPVSRVWGCSPSEAASQGSPPPPKLTACYLKISWLQLDR